MKKNKFILIFIGKAIFLYLIWFICYDLWLKKVGDVDDYIINNLVYLAFEGLSFLGYFVNMDGFKLSIVGAKAGVRVGSGCNGLELLVLFSGFVLIFEGSWKHKFWFIPAGIIILHFLNVLRIMVLALNGLTSKAMLEFNHKYTFTILLYCLTFFGWYLWVKYFSNIQSGHHENTGSE
jgi:exosortase family protein XrtF